MKRILVLFLLSGLYFNHASSQDLYLNGTIGLNMGVIQNPIEINQQLLFYKPGGGLKLNAGIEYWTENNLIWNGQLGINASFFSRYYILNNGAEYLSSYSFNWKSIEASLSKFILTEDSRNIDGFSIGGGMSLAIPGTAKLTENNQYLGSAEYQVNIGYHILFNGYIEIHDLILVPGMRLNILNFQMKNFEGPGFAPPDERFFNQNTLGASFMMTFGKRINKVQD
ncbi:hypothetical protein QYS49_28330 [Marivirga salinae]|uniref:Outer membrane protein beta-barrel domain-containing protein n=1 Tax=Marivirga salinarum TaxID=3059078 RepID=A0AA49GGJ6_9BACT|nr:hypothetical protein [Marivirga sp. BDSF4-3]WKK75407.2 hypothetical protein QYS49_28330 [Marivirga sp. BDSF4-3]